MSYRLVIFDFDGTLADTFPWFASVLNRVADKYNFKKITPDECETLRHLNATDILKYLAVPSWKVPLVANHMRALMAKNINQIALFDGVDGLLCKLAERNIKLGIASSNSTGNVRRVLGLKNSNFISYLECGASISGKKAKLKRILRRSQIPIDQAIYIGDEIRDIEAASSINMAVGSVSWGYNQAEALQKYSPTVFFQTMDEIAEKCTQAT